MNSTEPSADALGRLACAALRGEAPAWPFGADVAGANGFVQYCGYHGIGPLVREAMADKPIWQAWHGAVRERLEHEYRALTALEMLRQRETSRLLEAFHQAGIITILLKGTALAYGLYAEPTLRTRTDTDLLIEPAAKEAAYAVLRAQGYDMPNATTGEYVSTQRLFLKDEQGAQHAIDLHWQISNSQVFAQQFSFGELWQSGVAVAQLGAAACRLSAGYALLHACLHRAVHAKHGEKDRLQWFYDMHLLAGEMDQPQWDHFVELAQEKAIGAICADALNHCIQMLHTEISGEVMAVLKASGSKQELSAPLLEAGGFQTTLINYRALPSWRARAKLLREQVLPSPDYMRQRYGVSGVLPLSRAYVARLLRGPARLFTRTREV